ncbi:PilZ domain-containing protein [Piscinibacter sakaiensis]|uniref:PilZ domain-containing protein n=1 Tax=Piscinibacter sakaiensis TaxID=1547922 RepID=UPI003AAC07B8
MSPNRRRFARIVVDLPAWIESGRHRWPVTVIDLSFKGALVKIPPACQISAGTNCELGLVNTDDMARADKAFVHMDCEVRHSDGSMLRLACLQLDDASLEQLREMFACSLGDPMLEEVVFDS